MKDAPVRARVTHVEKPCRNFQTPFTVQQHCLPDANLRARGKTEVQDLALNKGVQRKRKLWSQAGQQLLRELPLKPWASRRREDLLHSLEMFHEQIAPLDAAVNAEEESDSQARLLMTQPGVGPITSSDYVLTMDDVADYCRGKQMAGYIGLIPSELSSGAPQELGGISKQGNRMLRMMRVEADGHCSALRSGVSQRVSACAGTWP